jgi:hypothetical protein
MYGIISPVRAVTLHVFNLSATCTCGLAFGVGVVFGIFAQPLVDHELVELDLTTVQHISSLIVVKYSWIRSTTTSVTSPERL